MADILSNYLEAMGSNPSNLYDSERVRDFISVASLKDELTTHKHNRWLRIIMSAAVFGYVCYYTRVILQMVDKSGNIISFYHLDNEVLITLLTSTTINIIGLMTIVVKYLFPNGSENEDE